MVSKAKRPARKSQVSGSLSRYHAKRDFSITDEPRGAGTRQKRPSEGALPFVVQKHAATRLHYDFRLGWDGVLKSWAVTKGPSYNPADKRLAVQVEDHPWEYRDFEGIIPKGQYGGGTVMVWDQGTWIPHGDVDQCLRDGHLKFELHGKKLQGDWVLVRMHTTDARSDRQNWLLIKEKDKFARDEKGKAITDEAPNSVSTKRSLEQIATGKSRVWNSNRGDDNADAAAKPGRSQAVAAEKKPKQVSPKVTKLVSDTPTEKFPGFIAPQLAQVAKEAPAGNDWLHELKLDGYRIQIQIQPQKSGRGNDSDAKLLTRKGLDWSARMPDVARAAASLGVKAAILDGEAVVLDRDGVSNFADLQAAFQEGRQSDITYFAFDVLHLNGHNLRNLDLAQRRRILESLFEGIKSGPLRLSEALEGGGDVIFEKACGLGAEGIISKLASAKYNSGRSGAWLKLKCNLEQELVIGGFTLPSNGIDGVGSLLLGYYENGKLRYAGRTGTGFTQKVHKSLRAKLNQLAAKESPFAEVPRDMQRGVRWVKPELVAQVRFTTWTRDNLVRQAAFKGLREDKPAREVSREAPGAAKQVDDPSPQRKQPAAQQRNLSSKAEHHLTHPDKVLDPESGLTKRALADYYAEIAEHMLPHVGDRPLSVVRCPEGSKKPCFFQKHVGMGVAHGVNSVSVKNRKSGAIEKFLTINSAEGLIGLAQMGVMEIHIWGSRNDSLDHPDRIVIDLDPDSEVTWEELAGTALECKKRLAKLGLKSFLKSTGGKGLHVVVPIEPVSDWREVKDFAHEFVLQFERENPALYITKSSLAARKGKIFLDYLRNDREATSIAPYSTRARSGAPVSMPLNWNELRLPNLPKFYALDFEEWKRRLKRDPWEEMLKTKQSISKELRKSA